MILFNFFFDYAIYIILKDIIKIRFIKHVMHTKYRFKKTEWYDAECMGYETKYFSLNTNSGIQYPWWPSQLDFGASSAKKK